MVDWKICIDTPQQRALDLCGGSLTKGDGYGGHPRALRRGGGYGWGDGGWGCSDGDGYGTGTGDGHSGGYGCGDGGSATKW